ncbi:MAG TPA: hypothetical protein ENH46_00730 [Candidatus Pacearchaeota archaeon]|nr:hypothetical protein [Candidatus Pacearchaeota archaeon]
MSLSDKRKEYFEKEFSELRNDGLQLATIKRIEFIQKKVQEQDKQSIKELIETIDVRIEYLSQFSGLVEAELQMAELRVVKDNIKLSFGSDLCEDKGVMEVIGDAENEVMDEQALPEDKGDGE